MTIKDIAELAQVSKGTVSKTLNGQPGVGKETRERILKLVDQLDFHPNSSAQALAFNKTENIGLLIPHLAEKNIDGAYWSSILSGIASKSSEMGLNLMLFTAEQGGDISKIYNILLKRRSIDGLIIGSELVDDRAISALFSSEIPFVTLGKSQRINHYYVDIDNYQGSYDMVKYMIDSGYKRIAFLCGPTNYFHNEARTKGYCDAIKDADLDYCFFHSTPYEKKDTIEGIEKILKSKPDALFLGAGGTFLFDTIEGVKSMNLNIPDFGLAIFDDYKFMDYIDPRITAIRQPLYKLGVSSVQMLRAVIDKGIPDVNPIILSTEIVVRESCGELIKSE